MKESNYNYYVPYENKTIIFNGLSKSMFVVSKENAPKFKSILQNPSKYSEKFGFFLDKMLEHGFVCKGEKNEYAYMMNKYRESLWPNYYRLMILPTYKCNLSCWYCVQEHRHVDMSSEVIKRIKTHIKKYLSTHDINVFYLTWFGGEPLIQYKTILDISSYAKEVCENLGIEMKGGITTNSLLLTRERIRELGKLNINFFQITIDGNREDHNKVKHLPNVDTFNKSLSNIVDIIRIIPNASVNLRINYSKKTLESLEMINQINEIIPKEFRRQIEVSPKKIWQEDDNSINQQDLADFSDYIDKSGYNIESTEFGICYVDYKHSTTIFPNGKIDICNLDNQDGRATLSEEGNIIWKEEDLCFQQSADKENIICNECKHFPICGGPCPVRRNSMIRENGKVYCIFENSETMHSRMEREVIKYYKEMVYTKTSK